MADEQTTEYDLAEIRQSPIDAIVAKFDALSDPQLDQLRALEQAAEKPRSTLIAAIDGALEARTAAKDQSGDKPGDADKMQSETGNQAGVGAQGAPAAQVESGVPADAAAQAAGAVQAEIDQLREDNAALRTENAELKAKLSAAEAKADKAKPARDPKAVRFTEDGKVAAEDLCRVAFEGSDGLSIPGIAALTFGPEAFEVVDDHGGLVLNQAIAFPRSGPEAEVHAAWLQDGKGQKGRRCRIIGGLVTGGGRSAELPSGHLRFDVPHAA